MKIYVFAYILSARDDRWAKVINIIAMNITEVSKYLYCLSWNPDWYNDISSILYKKWLSDKTHRQETEGHRKELLVIYSLDCCIHIVKISPYDSAKSCFNSHDFYLKVWAKN